MHFIYYDVPKIIELEAEKTREGNGNPLQYSCLENPMDGGAWWATVRGVSESHTRLIIVSEIHLCKVLEFCCFSKAS